MMHSHPTDLNLFVVFDAIYSEGSVSRASQRLFLSQPAVSHALGRLRIMFDDMLFERRGHVMIATTVAHRSIGPVREALRLLEQAVAPLPSRSEQFGASTSTREFTIGSREHTEFLVTPTLMKRLAISAPAVTLRFVRIDRRLLERDLATGRLDAAIDILLPVDETIAHEQIGTSALVVMARRRHPLLAAGLDAAAYLDAEHVQVSARRTGMSIEDFELNRSDVRRKVRLRCQNYVAAAETVASTNLLLTLPEHHARRLAKRTAVAVVACPVDLPPLESFLYWHTNKADDSANVWLRTQITGASPFG